MVRSSSGNRSKVHSSDSVTITARHARLSRVSRRNQSPTQKPVPAPLAAVASRDASWLVHLLVLAAALAFYVPTLSIPFLGDDYVFLDKTRLAHFNELWSRTNTDFGWYRPWSREFHFWTLQNLFGADPIAFRIANLVLWVAGLFVFAAAMQRITGRRIAAMVMVGVASLGLWGAPLLWISGSQDLWMFFFLSLGLWCVSRGRDHLALIAYAGALLSKETAAVFPLLAILVWAVASRYRWREVLRRTVPFCVLTLTWMWFHPMLFARLRHGHLAVPGAEDPLPTLLIVWKTMLAMVNADQLGDQLMPTPGTVLSGVLGGVLLIAAMWFASAPRQPDSGVMDRRRLAWVGAGWAAAGWIPLFLPSISWHAYYGCIGALGAWVVLVALLGNRRSGMLSWVILVCVLRIFNSSSRAWDWGSEWYQRRAGVMLSAIQTQLLIEHPKLAPHTRVYFGSIPNNIGLVAGSSPAVRVWYRDSTLQAGFYSYYRPRGTAEPTGEDLFFHFDSTRGLRPVLLGPENALEAVRLDPEWESNHEALANTLLGAGDPERAADELEKIGGLPHRPDALAFSGLCREVAGDSARARELFTLAARRMGGAPGEFAGWLLRVRSRMPRPRR